MLDRAIETEAEREKNIDRAVEDTRKLKVER